ncbi:MAG: ferrous iron transporter B [Ruminococcaceae bacterium]|nr:ferrous iron transporter B [Oscillospiraceae bacterium]
MRIAFAGNPNSGKTTMYNALCGRNETVGNWAGVTVDKKESTIKKAYANGIADLVAVDLPGAYSMSPFTAEESITNAYIRNEKPDVIVNIVDATNLSRSLFFTTQLLELGIPVVVALNKSDINQRKETVIDAKTLSCELGCPVVQTVSTDRRHSDLAAVIAAAIALNGKGQKAPYIQGNIDLTDKAAVQAADRRRFAFVNALVARVETRKVFTKDKTRQDRADALLTNKWLGIPIFAAVMFLVFQISQAWLGPLIAEGYTFKNGNTVPGLVTLIDRFGEWVGGLLTNADPLVSALLVDGIIGGVGAVVGFLPLVMVMYFLIALLEDCGYMARVSVVLDPIFKKVGLSGKSVIPFVIGTGCAVPGVMACRTIRNERERRATAMLAPFMPCGAKLPIIGLFAGAFFKNASWVGTLMYFVGIFIIFIGALLINRITGNRKHRSYFIIELPDYKAPSLSRAFLSMCARGWAYVVKAATVILLCNTVVQVMQSFTGSFTVAETADSSILAAVAVPFAYLLIPVAGVLSWQLAAAAITGFVAKENVVGTFAVCFVGLEYPFATQAAALAYLMFNLFTPPCFAAIAAMGAEMKSAKWLWSGIALQLGTGFTVGFLVYQAGTLITEGTVGAGFVGGLLAVLGFAAILVVLCVHADKQAKAEKANKQRKTPVSLTK